MAPDIGRGEAAQPGGDVEVDRVDAAADRERAHRGLAPVVERRADPPAAPRRHRGWRRSCPSRSTRKRRSWTFQARIGWRSAIWTTRAASGRTTATSAEATAGSAARLASRGAVSMREDVRPGREADGRANRRRIGPAQRGQVGPRQSERGRAGDEREHVARDEHPQQTGGADRADEAPGRSRPVAAIRARSGSAVRRRHVTIPLRAPLGGARHALRPRAALRPADERPRLAPEHRLGAPARRLGPGGLHPRAPSARRRPVAPDRDPGSHPKPSPRQVLGSQPPAPGLRRRAARARGRARGGTRR